MNRLLRPPLPNSQTYAWLALALIAFAVYVSLIPFELRSLPLSLAWEDFWTSVTSAGQRFSRTNFLANVLLFVPLGFMLMGTMLVDRPRSLVGGAAALIITVALSLCASTTAEFLQVYAPERVPSGLDILAQTIGTALGIAIWIAIGPAITLWLRAAANARARDRLARVLTAYVAAWAFANLAPFDITVDLGQLARRFRSGDIVLVPFGGPTGAARLTWDLFAALISVVPLGVFGLARARRCAAARPELAGFAVGAAIVVLMECAHVFIRSHSADVNDVIFGTIGVAVGVMVGRRVLSMASARPAVPSGLPVSSSWAINRRAFIAFTAWCVVLAAYHWLPYDFVVDSEEIRRKLTRMSLLPFTGYRGSDLNAFNDVLVKVGLAIPLGLAASLTTSRVGHERRSVGVHTSEARANWGFATVAWLLVAAVVFAIVELGQFFVRARIPDPTDVLLGLAGTYVGLRLGRWLGWQLWLSYAMPSRSARHR